jgi:hypothetical protein
MLAGSRELERLRGPRSMACGATYRAGTTPAIDVKTVILGNRR